MRISFFVIIVLLLACRSYTQKSIILESVWKVSEGLYSPESIIVDSVRDFIYVSNSREYGFTGTGYISKHDINGNLLDSMWVSGLNRPTGMAIFESNLYVADINKLLVIDIDSGIVTSEYQTAGDIPGFNDVIANREGLVFVTASNFHSIYRLQDGIFQLFLTDTTNLKWANGIISYKDQLTVAGMSLSQVNLTNNTIETGNSPKEIADFDGIQLIRNSEYLVSSAGGANKIWHIDREGNAESILGSDCYFGDFFKVENKLYTPSGNHQTSQYWIQCFKITYE